MTPNESPPEMGLAPGGGPMPRREQLTFVVFATWMVTGLFVDGWAHRRDAPETFFTPWHGILYSGFAAALAWGAMDGWRQAWQRRRTGLTRHAVAGERLSAVGAAVFAAGGVADMAWHEVFGVEEDLNALLSPTHLALALGGILAATAPLRAAWTTSPRAVGSVGRFWPVVFSAALATSVAAFFTQFLSPFLLDELTMATEEHQAHGVASVLFSTAMLVVPVLMLRRRWATPPGTFTLFFAIVGVLTSALDGFGRWPLVVAAVAAGVAADGLAPRTSSLPWFSAGVTAVLWASFFGIWAITEPFGWTAEMWTGSIALAAGTAWALGLLAGWTPGGVALDSTDVALDHALDRAPEETAAR